MAKQITTHSGHKLTFREAKFIEYLTAGKSEKEAVMMAGFASNYPAKLAKILLGKEYIAEELEYRYQAAKEANIADATEILTYYSNVMRGTVKDQFGLDAPLAERTKAATELAKRVIDYKREAELANKDSKIELTLNWEREPAKENVGDNKEKETTDEQHTS